MQRFIEYEFSPTVFSMLLEMELDLGDKLWNRWHTQGAYTVQ